MADLEEVDVERHPPGGDCSLSTPVLTRQAVDGRNPGLGDEGPDGWPKNATGCYLIALGRQTKQSRFTVETSSFLKARLPMTDNPSRTW